MMKNFDEFQGFGRDQLDAFVASGTAMTKGLQTIATEIADYSKKSFEDSAAAFEKALAAKSVDKALEVQTNHAKAAYESYVGELTKIGELYMQTAKEAYKPFEGAVAELANAAGGKKGA